MNMLGSRQGWQLEMPKARFVSLLARDVAFYRNLFAATGWSVD